MLTITDEVRDALASGQPVVALESTIISHGMPYPQNVEMARTVEGIVRDGGAVPATIAVSTTPPFALFSPLLRSCAATAAGNFTRHSAEAARAVTAFADTSTIAGRPWASMCVSAGFLFTP